jgi:acetolactate synthase regulatory subunit
MSAVTQPIPAPPAASPARRCRLAIGTTGSADVLVRALTLLRRRGCRIVSVDYQSGDRHAPERFELAVEAPARTEHRLESWLLGLVDVLEVRASQ